MPLDLDGEGGSLEPFAELDETADRARFAYIVEMDHFIHEKYAFRLMCIRYLVSRGWTWFGEELDPRVGDRVDRYLSTGDEALLDPVDEPDWYTSGVLVQAVARHPKQAFDAEQRRFAQGVRRCARGVRWFGFDIGGGDADYLEAANAADTFDALQPVMALRERMMHERVARVAGENPDAKIALMAGSLHLMKDDDRVSAPGGVGPGGLTDRSIGHFVAHELTDAPILSMWMLHGTGTSANPWLEPPGSLQPATDTIDAELAAVWDRPCFAAVADDSTQRRVTQMHNMVMTCRLRDQADAIVFVPEVGPISA